MSENKKELKDAIKKLEKSMNDIYFWDNKIKAQEIIKHINFLKNKISGLKKYDKNGVVLSILSGAGGDDAEDFSFMLMKMYMKYIEKKGWKAVLLHENKNDNGGYRNISIEIKSNSTDSFVYRTLKNESGVHRLVRISPFNAKSKRHTSFSMVEVIPILSKNDTTIELSPDDLKIEFSKSSGPGGQNVNKRETAVRIVHIPTNLSAHISTERTQEQNKEKAMVILKSRILRKMEEDKKREKEGLSISKTTEIEWGNQIRSYVLHPYKMVKDHRTGIEVRDVDSVLEKGEIDEFIKAEENL